MKGADHRAGVALNAICPYFTMFPLEFPLKILSRDARHGDAVLDPFCGRGTTNFAARLVGIDSLGVDSSPIAAAITAAKLVSVGAEEILDEARSILKGMAPKFVPSGEFWTLAFHSSVLDAVCRYREALLENCTTSSRIALRGILLGALHGPKQKTFASYFSNQSPRSYAPKPRYATRFWRERGLRPDAVDVLGIIERRARRYYGLASSSTGAVRQADSRDPESLLPEPHQEPFRWVITSPPYYGMRTYIPDQWLRNWFLGGPDTVDYTNHVQVVHSSPTEFSDDLRKVWRNARHVCADDSKLIVRFGGISDRRANPLDVIKSSFAESGWRVKTVRKAGSANHGKRQADAFLRKKSEPLLEYDVWARP